MVHSKSSREQPEGRPAVIPGRPSDSEEWLTRPLLAMGFAPHSKPSQQTCVNAAAALAAALSMHVWVDSLSLAEVPWGSHFMKPRVSGSQKWWWWW
jgi:hypothetical protein